MCDSTRICVSSTNKQKELQTRVYVYSQCVTVSEEVLMSERQRAEGELVSEWMSVCVVRELTTECETKRAPRSEVCEEKVSEFVSESEKEWGSE